MPKFAAQDIKGFTPGIDPTVSEDTYVIEGRNYVFDSLGPRSQFGNELLAPQPIHGPEHVQAFKLRLRIGDRNFTFTNQAIMEWRESIGGWRIITPITDTTGTPYRWTYGYLSDKLYMAHPVGGFFVYDLITQMCVPHAAASDVALDSIIAVTVCCGRLCAISHVYFYWSAASDGLDFTPRLGGAGFQQISDRVSGSPIFLTSYSRGCLTWTTEGVLRSEFTGDVQVFRHKAITTDYRPINSFCVTRVDDDTTVIVDERGLFLSQGETIKPFAPLFNEFLIRLIQDKNLHVGQNIRLEYDSSRRLFFVSVSLSYSSPLYEEAYVYYAPLDKWGQFNESHYGILPARVDYGSRADDYFGFVDAEGYMRIWNSAPWREVSPANSDNAANANLHQAVIQTDFYVDPLLVGCTMPSVVGISTVESSFVDVRVSGWYAADGEVKIVPSVVGLDSHIRVGLIRAGGDNADRMGEISSLILRSTQSALDPWTPQDFNLNPPANLAGDWGDRTGTVDLGYSTRNYVGHTLELTATLDGISEFQTEIPTLARQEKGARYFTCLLSGIWFIVSIGAETPGEYYHLHTLELTATDGGIFL